MTIIDLEKIIFIKEKYHKATDLFVSDEVIAKIRDRIS